MRRNLLLAGLLFLWGMGQAAADGRHNVRLCNDGHESATVNLYDCNLFITMGEPDYNDDVILTVGLENLYGAYLEGDLSFLIFDKTLEEKALRRQTPSIVFDKIFGGRRGHRTVEACTGLHNPVQVAPGDKRQIVTLTVSSHEPVLCRLPLYISRYKGKGRRKMTLLEKRVEELAIEIELKPDAAYLALSADVDTLVHAMETKTFTVCRHKGTAHFPSLEEQKDSCRLQIDALRSRIADTMEKRNYMSTDKGYRLYSDLLRRLDGIDLEKAKVDEHKVAVQTCGCSARIRNMTLRQIYNKMEDDYQRIYTGKVSKGQVLSEVNAMKVHSTHVKRDPDGLKRGIEKYYNKIKALP